MNTYIANNHSKTATLFKTNKKKLFYCHVLIAALTLSLILPFTSDIWRSIDIFFFKMVNGTLAWGKGWQSFWALANHKKADWIEDIFFLLFFTAYVKQGDKSLRLKKIAELLFLILISVFIIYFVNCKLFREGIAFTRESPTLVVDSSIRLSEQVTWLKVKEGSSKSFPGDHGTTAMLFAMGFSYFAGRRLGLLAIIYSVFLCLPRLITGAHWLSDIVVGSGSIALFFLGWSFFTPFGSWCIQGLERSFLKIQKLKNQWA